MILLAILALGIPSGDDGATFLADGCFWQFQMEFERTLALKYGGGRYAEFLPEATAALLRNLGERSFRTREDAESRFLMLGLDDLDACRALVWGLASSDPEVRSRCERVLRRLRVARDMAPVDPAGCGP